MVPVHRHTASVAHRHLTFSPRTGEGQYLNLYHSQLQNGVLFESGPGYLCTTVWMREASGPVGLQRGPSWVSLASVSLIKDLTNVEMSVNCSFAPSCLHTVVTISL